METRTIDDILLSQYIRELSTSQSIARQCDPSPYKLPLKHTNILASHRSLLPCHSSPRIQNSARSKSSDPAGAQQRSKISVSGNGLTEGKEVKRNQSIDGDDGDDIHMRNGNQRPSSQSRNRRTRSDAPSYLQVPAVYVVTAFRNGDRTTSARVSAPNFEKLLEQCTIKLGLSSSARKLFLASGKEVPRVATIPRGTEIYVSMGEAFKDPAKLLEKRINTGADVHWTLNGINLPSDREREATKPASTPRGLSDKATRRRVLIFANGKGINGIEVLANIANIGELMYNCTLKFNSGQHIKRILLMDGSDVENIEHIPEVDPLLNSSHGTPLLGPVWASKGEDISPMGVEEYLRDVIRFVKRKWKVSRAYRRQLELVYHSDRESLAKDKELKDRRILSMSDDEIMVEIDTEGDKLSQYNAFLQKHKQLLEDIEPEARTEQEEGSKFTMKHIHALPENHSLVSGSPGLRVTVFMNGKDSDPVKAYFNIQEASRGLKKDKNRKQIVFQRFLDCLSANSLLANKNSKSKGILVRRVFAKSGAEITDAMLVEQEQHIWISHGEDWIDPFTYCMQAEISKVTEWMKRVGEAASRRASDASEEAANRRAPEESACRRFAIVRSEMPQIDEKSTWQAQIGVPDGIEQLILPEPEPQNEEEETPKEEKLPEESVPEDGCFLQNSKNKRLCLFVEPVVGTQRLPREAPKAGDGDEKAKHVWPVWPRAGISQIWVVHDNGQISLKHFKLALTLVDAEIQTSLQGASMTGRLVQFTPMEEDRVPAAQRWSFSKDGLIYSQLEPGFALTYLGGLVDEQQTRPINGLHGSSLGYRNILAACEPLASRDDLDGKLREQLEKHQRFGLRLSKFENFSNWRKAGEDNEKEKSDKHKDPNWSKLALFWPTDKNGELIQDKNLDWPLECHVVAFAPPLKEFKPETESPKRFFCLKNGERNEKFGVCVTAPDMTNMKKQKKHSKTAKKRKHQKRGRQEEADSVVEDDYIHVPRCSDVTVKQVEFKIFLECCTSLLGLSSAARRVFDDMGVEHFSLEKLERDQKLFVSVGEPWADPKYSKQQLEARSMLVKLAEDVDKIRSFVALKKTAALVIAAESLTAGSRLGVSKDLLTKRERRAKQLQESQSPPDANFESSSDDDEEEDDHELGLTAHERACRRSDERRSGLKWPWEKIVSNDLDPAAEDSTEQPAPTPVKKRRENKNLSLKQFILEDGFISAKESPNLVLTAADSAGVRVLEVTLEKRALDNPYQRWLLNKNGSISLKYRPTNVLTVKLPNVTLFSSETVDIESSVLTVQPLKAHQFGRAHQLFAVDSERSTVRCFATNSLDIACTAANQSGCCSYYVTADKGERLDQPGYVAYLETRQQPGQQSRTKACSVCVSCAKSLRGKYKLQKIVPGAKTDFACAFGKSAELGLKERGSFAMLNDRVDLVEGEDKASLKRWEDEIQEQRKKLSVKAIANRLSDAQTPRPIRVLAYRNGEGRLCKPVPIYSSSVQGIMDQCASKLRISWAVRKLYLEDGTPVLDMDDLRNWCAAHSEQVRKRQKEIDEGRLQPEMDEIRAEVDKTGTPRVDPPPENSPRSPKKPGKRDSLEPRLKPKYFVVGSNFTTPTVYTLAISLYALNFLDEILPLENLESGDTQMIVRYSIFGLAITTDPFTNEDAFEGEKREIQLKSELPVLRRFFKEKLTLLKFDLVRMPEETVLATCYVPLDTLVREEHEEFVNPAKIAADYAWYRKSAEKPKGERTHASLHVEISITVSIDIDVDNDDDEENMGEPEEPPEQQSGADAAEDTNASSDESAKPAAQDAAPPDLQDLCIELWASTGEAFVPLRTAHKEFREMVQQRKDLRQVLNSKDADKHILKMMQGRRLQAQEPGTFRPTTDPEHPVAVEGDWQTPKGEEVMVEREISELEAKEAKIREKHFANATQPRRATLDFDRQLYRQSSMMRLRVFANGEDPKTATTVWAETIHQVLDTASVRLGLRKPARILFSLDGKDVHDISKLSRDQLLCVSTGEPFQPPGAVFESVEIKANWGRAKRQYGPGATSFHVQARGHPLVGVDPFGPPLHSANARQQQLQAPPVFDSRRVRVFENGRAIGTPESIFGESLEALLAAATKRLNLRSPAVCFYNVEGHQVVSFSEISRDDLLFASTTSKGFIRPERR